MDGKIHRDYVMVGGQQCAFTASRPSCRGLEPRLATTQPIPPPAAMTMYTRPRVVCRALFADMITTVVESAYHGRCTSSSVPAGIILVKTRFFIVLATYQEPITAAEAIPHVHKFAETLSASLSI